MLKVISTEKAPAAIGPYSQAMVFGNLMISSGPVSYTHLDVYKRQVHELQKKEKLLAAGY